MSETRTIASGIWRQWNFANTLTAGRMISPIMLIPCLAFELWLVAFFVFLIAAVTDLEGWWARLTNTTTPLGRVFDPVADKILANGAIIALMFVKPGAFIVTLFVFNFLYDIDNMVRRFKNIVDACYAHDSREEAPVTWVSKAKTGILNVTIGVVILSLYSGGATREPRIVGWSLMAVQWSETLVIVSIILVLTSWWQNRKEFIISVIAGLRR